MASRLIKVTILLIPLWLYVFYGIYKNYNHCGLSPTENPTTKGRVVFSSIKKSPYMPRAVEVTVSYEYFVNDKRYVSNRIDCGSTGDGNSYNKYPRGSEVKVYYREDKPELSVLEPQLVKTEVVTLVFALIISIFFLLGSIILKDRDLHDYE